MKNNQNQNMFEVSNTFYLLNLYLNYIEIVIDSWSSDPSLRKQNAQFFEYLKNKPLATDPVGCFKALVLTHKILQHASPVVSIYLIELLIT
jgi:hypothetical protein